MKLRKFLLKLDLHLFDGGAAAGGAGAGAADGGAGEAAAAGSNSTGASANGRAGKNGSRSGEPTILYGKQPQEDGTPDAGEKKQDPKERARKYREYIKGDGKEFFDADVHRIINDRFKDAKGLKEQNEELQKQLAAQKPIIDRMAEKYGIDDCEQITSRIDSDVAMWEREAEEAGFDSVEQYRNYKKLERQNAEYAAERRRVEGAEHARRHIAALQEQVDAMRQKYPDFDINAEISNPEFKHMIDSGVVSVEQAFKITHFDELTKQAAEDTERRVVENIRARGNRPAEGGASSQTGVQIKSDPSKYTPEDRRRIAELVRKGKQIIL